MRQTSYHNEKMPELIAHLAAEFIGLESNRTSLITVTGCKLSPDNKYGTVFFTVLPDNQEKAASDFLKRKRKEFRMFVREKSRIGRTPDISFALDLGEKNRQKIDFLSNSD
jgi:ribosome-binding factor A